MGTFIPRFLRFDGYETRDIREFHKDGRVEIHLERSDDKPLCCYRCHSVLKSKKGHYRQTLKELPLMKFATFILLWRWQGFCPTCKKVRSEHVDFISKESPHATKDFSWFLGKLCEVTAVKNAAEFYGVSAMSAWRHDFERMQLMMKYYKIPPLTQISVDEVYARRKGKDGESRNRKFFTVITDLKTRRVVYVSESRDKDALDEFFKVIGADACAQIKVVAMDQHEAYRSSVREHCPKAKVVWDRFHLMQSFNEVLDTIRREVLAYSPSSKEKQLLQGKYRFIFLKRSSQRSSSEKAHIDEIQKENDIFIKLELIKERLLTFFDETDTDKAWKIFDEIGDWIEQLGFKYLKDWYRRLEEQWETLSNYFTYRVTTSLSEGINNVIKALKRQAYGYRNMQYFRLKIMQRCGYLNSRHIPNIDYLLEY